MSDVISSLMNGIDFAGNLAQDVTHFLERHGCPRTAQHSREVATECERIAQMVNANVEQATTAGWLHDISAVFPTAERIQIAQHFALDILPEEAAFPMIIHQKLSAVLAQRIFQIEDKAILSAIECHTTLKASAGVTDKVVFVADKIAWDQPGTPPYLDDLRAALAISLDRAALVYVDFLWNQREQLRVVHPWLIAAREDLLGNDA